MPGFEDGLLGASAGEQRTVAVTFPAEYQVGELAGRDAVFEITVNEVREKLLPELNDDFATDAAGFDTLEEMREELRSGLLEADERVVEREYRGAVLDAAVAAATISVPLLPADCPTVMPFVPAIAMVPLLVMGPTRTVVVPSATG